ncbi:hypothetical protein [Ruegeria profundi]|uniref:Uncharacterized protein n=1 Tax=Ruegeria profundi TaxID=1685378 RepID=A0A0X3T949_9RHOB|nr:hypothetical protein [Ruegeria profundi]KUJ72243.1 hypothetical protein AVO44_20370 [Ruegeria profundi]
MKRTPTLFACCALAVVAGCMETTTSEPKTVSAPASGPGELAGFVGARAGQAELGLQNRGYSLVRSQGLTSFWLKNDGSQCAAITTSDGRYSDIAMVPADVC